MQQDQLTKNEIVLAGLGTANAVEFGRGKSESSNRGLKNAARSEMGASTYRVQFLERVHLLPKEVQQALANGRAQISDSPYFSTAAIEGTRSEVIKVSQSEEKGITNIDNGKLGKDRHMTLSGIRLLYDANDINGAYTDTYPAGLLNGSWELELNGKKLFEKQPIRRFFDGFFGYNTQLPFGLYPLKNVKNIDPQTPIEFNIDTVGTVAGFVKVFLEGTTVYGY